MSSAVGRFGMPLSSAYVATKFALEGLSESMRYELKEFGINIVIIEPGVIKTNFVENSETTHPTSKSKSPYADIIERVSKGFGR
jgi:short-subunit dehydrogenase